MKKQIISLFIASIVLIGMSSIFLFIRREKEIDLQWLTENSRSQLDLLGDLVQSEIEKMKTQMAQVATLVESGQVEDAQKSLGGFVGVAAVDPESKQFLWKVQVAPESANPQKEEWNAQWIQKLFSGSSEELDLKFYSVQSANGEIRSAISLMANIRNRKTGQISRVQLIGLAARAFFQELVDKLKGQGVHVFLTAPSGLTLAHTVSEYVGNSMVGDRTYEDIRNQKSTFGTIVAKDFRGENLLSFYVKLPEAQLTLASQWRKEMWISTDWSFYGQVILVLLTLAVLNGALAQYLIGRMQQLNLRPLPSKIKVQEINTDVLSSLEVESESSKKESDITPCDEVNEWTKNSPPPPLKSEAPLIPLRPPSFMSLPGLISKGPEPQISLKVLERVVSILRAPLLSVLGHVQMARLNPQGGSLQAIETEVRTARDVLDRVGHYSGLAEVPSITVPLFEVIDSSLRLVEASILRGGVKVVREIPADLAVKCDIDDLKNAFAAIFRNSVEAMEKNLRKTIFIRARKVEGMIELEIEDTGEGISPENVTKIFDPFYTTRSPIDHKGLGLSMTMGVLRQHDVQTEVKSRVGEGTILKLKIPFSREVVQPFNIRNSTSRTMRDSRTPSFEITEDSITKAVEEKNILFNQTETVSSFDLETFDSSQKISHFLDDDDDALGEFQFGKLDFLDTPENQLSSDIKINLESSVKSAKEVKLDLHCDNQDEKELSLEEMKVTSAPLLTSPSKRLKKKDEPLAKMKVQIPRPEERL